MSEAAWRDFGVSYPDTCLDRLVAGHARQKPDAPAVAALEGTMSWARLDDLASRLAAALRDRGLRVGDRLAWLGRNGLYFPAVLLAARRAGLILVGLNWRLSSEELTEICAMARPRLILGDTEFINLIPEHLEGMAVGSAFEAWAITFDPLRGEDMRPDAPTTLFFTSGTTGKPKGIVFSSEATERTVFAPTTLEFEPDSRLLIIAPVFHTAGWVWTQYALAGGMLQVQMPQATPALVLDMVGRWGVTHAQWVPTMMNDLLAEVRRNPADLSSLRMIAYGSAPIAERVLADCIEAFGCRFTQCYGMTESVGPITHLPPEAHEDRQRRSQATGIANPGLELRIADAKGRTLPPGESGEVWARFPFPIGAHLRADGDCRPVTDAEGWLHTGDIGHLDAEQYLHVTDRKKDVIITGGENVFPVEVEKVLTGMEGVFEAAVFPLPDERWGEKVAAALVPKEGAKIDADRIIAECRNKLAHYKCPKIVVEVACLPRNASGKLVRADLPGLFR